MQSLDFGSIPTPGFASNIFFSGSDVLYACILLYTIILIGLTSILKHLQRYMSYDLLVLFTILDNTLTSTSKKDVFQHQLPYISQTLPFLYDCTEFHVQVFITHFSCDYSCALFPISITCLLEEETVLNVCLFVLWYQGLNPGPSH